MDAAEALHGVTQLAKKDEEEEGGGEGGGEDSEWLSTVKAIHSKKPDVMQNTVFARNYVEGKNEYIYIYIYGYKERNVQVFL